jgi:hypothetical protein
VARIRGEMLESGRQISRYIYHLKTQGIKTININYCILMLSEWLVFLVLVEPAHACVVSYKVALLSLFLPILGDWLIVHWI